MAWRSSAESRASRPWWAKRPVATTFSTLMPAESWLRWGT